MLFFFITTFRHWSEVFHALFLATAFVRTDQWAICVQSKHERLWHCTGSRGPFLLEKFRFYLARGSERIKCAMKAEDSGSPFSLVIIVIDWFDILRKHHMHHTEYFKFFFIDHFYWLFDLWLPDWGDVPVSIDHVWNSSNEQLHLILVWYLPWVPYFFFCNTGKFLPPCKKVLEPAQKLTYKKTKIRFQSKRWPYVSPILYKNRSTRSFNLCPKTL